MLSADVLINDSRLQELSAEPVEDLYPTMKAASAAGPWIVLLAFLAPLAGFLLGNLDDRTAAWGLHSLDVMTRMFHGSESPLQPAQLPRVSLPPPLTAWLTAVMMRSSAPIHPSALRAGRFWPPLPPPSPRRDSAGGSVHRASDC